MHYTSDLDTLLVGMEGRVEAMILSFSLEMEDDSLEKSMGTLTPKWVLIRFPTRFN